MITKPELNDGEIYVGAMPAIRAVCCVLNRNMWLIGRKWLW